MISNLKEPQTFYQENHLGDTTVNLDSFSDPMNEEDPLNYLDKIKTNLDCTPEKEGSECLKPKKKSLFGKRSISLLFSKIKNTFQHPQKRKKFATIGLLLVLIGISNIWTPSFSPSPEQTLSSISNTPLLHPTASSSLTAPVDPKILPPLKSEKEKESSTVAEVTSTKTVSVPEKMTEYLVQRGDSLYKIAQDKLGSTSYVRELAKWNNLESPYQIKVGQVLKIPEKPSIKEESKDISVSPKASEPESVQADQNYEVRVGDSLYKIAAKKLGNGIYAKQLAEHNKIKDPSKIRVGQVLKIPLTLAKTDSKDTNE